MFKIMPYQVAPQLLIKRAKMGECSVRLTDYNIIPCFFKVRPRFKPLSEDVWHTLGQNWKNQVCKCHSFAPGDGNKKRRDGKNRLSVRKPDVTYSYCLCNKKQAAIRMSYILTERSACFILDIHRPGQTLNNIAPANHICGFPVPCHPLPELSRPPPNPPPLPPPNRPEKIKYRT